MNPLARLCCALALVLLYISIGIPPVTRSSTGAARRPQQHEDARPARAASSASLSARPAGATSIRKINLAANDLVFDPNTQTIYATGVATIGGVPTQISVPVVRLGEFLPDAQRIARDVIVGTAGWPERLEANKSAYAQEFVSRQRFLAAFPAVMPPSEFVDKLIVNAGIQLEAGERQALVDELAANNTTAGLAGVLRKVAEEPEMVSNETNRAFVLMQYFGYLRRNPNDSPDANHSGYNFWLTKLNSFNGDWRAAQMVESFLDSFEYRERFGS